MSENEKRLRGWIAARMRRRDAEEALTDLDALRAEHRAEVKRAEEVADSWSGRGQEAESRALYATARAEQAERERDEARTELARVRGLPDMEWAQASAVIMQGLALHARTDQPAAKRMAEALDKAKTYVDRIKARAERAEADNAALLGLLRDARDSEEDDSTWAERVLGALDAEHPGDALREYVRALETVRTAVEPTRRLTELFLASQHGHHATETERALVDACARADVLKSKPRPAAQPSTKRHWLNDVQECSDECPACAENMARGFNPDGTDPRS